MRRILAVLATTALMVAMLAMPASAQQQQGLVNVNVGDVTVQLPIAVAANVCNVNVAVLAQQFRQGGQAECTADIDQRL